MFLRHPNLLPPLRGADQFCGVGKCIGDQRHHDRADKNGDAHLKHFGPRSFARLVNGRGARWVPG